MPLDAIFNTAITAPDALFVNIEVTAPRSVIAPASFMLKANVAETETYNPASGEALPPSTDLNFLLANFEWNVSNIETDRQDVGNEISPRLLDRNREYGQRIMHMYVQPGLHFVSVKVIFADGRWGSASTTIEVKDPDVEYTAAETYVVAADGVFAGAPANGGATHQFTDVRAAWEYIRLNHPLGGKARILTDESQGLTYTEATWPLDLEVNNMRANEVYIGSWTRGSKVEFRMNDVRSALFTTKPDSANGNPNFVLKFEDVFMNAAAHDSRSETGVVMPNWVQEQNTTELIFNNCRSYGAGVLLDGTNNIPGQLIHINDHLNEMMADFIGILPHAGGLLAITGTKNVSPPDNAVGGLGKVFRETNWHNFVRAGFEFGYFVKNNIYGNSSWTGISYNSPFRLWRNNPGNGYCIIAASIITGQASSQLDDQVGDMKLRHLRFMNNYCILSPLDNTALVLMAGNAMIDNNIFIKHDTPDESGGNKWSGRSPVNLGSWKARVDVGGTTGLNDPIIARDNTIIEFPRNAEGTADGVGNGKVMLDLDGNGGGYFLNVEEAGTMVHRPNAPTPIVQPLDTTPLGFDSPCDALRINWVEVKNFVLPSNIGPGDSFDVPYAGNFLSELEGRQLDQTQFTDLTLTPERNSMTGIDHEDDPNVTYQIDTPSAGFITVTNTGPYTWQTGDTLRARFYAPPYDSGQEQIVHKLDADVPTGGTVVIENGDNIPTATTGHVRINTYGIMSLVPTAAGMTITNAGTNTWLASKAADIKITLGNNPVRETSIAHPAGTISLYRPTTAVTETAPPDYLRSAVDFEMQPRPGSLHPEAPAGDYCIGYLNAA